MSVFAHLDNVSAMIDAVKDRPEIHVTADEVHGIGYIMYAVAFEDTFQDPNEAGIDADERLCRLFLHEARGLKYDLKTFRPVSRPYHKFYNLMEKAWTQLNLIDFTQPHVVLEKLDGSMVTPLLFNGEIKMMTKRGVTDVSANANVMANTRDYFDFIVDMYGRGLTPIFEWCSRRNRIILDYPEDRLVLTGIRDNVTGEYVWYDDMVIEASVFDIPVVKLVARSVGDINDFIASARQIENEEGYIIRFTDGSMFKIKGEWYCRLHSTLDLLRFEKDILRLVLTGDIDDAKPFMAATMVSTVEGYSAAVRAAIAKNVAEQTAFVLDLKTRFTLKKDFVREFKATGDNRFEMFAFKLFENDTFDMFDSMVQLMLKHTHTQNRVNEYRYLIGGVTWDGFDKAEVIDLDA